MFVKAIYVRSTDLTGPTFTEYPIRMAMYAEVYNGASESMKV